MFLAWNNSIGPFMDIHVLRRCQRSANFKNELKSVTMTQTINEIPPVGCYGFQIYTQLLIDSLTQVTAVILGSMAKKA